ncbi:expressed unknown protein [Seminavis robusta]|uniref:TFIIB-type domain-containing protein n=1 Tax=Seminavis robusta TaxID=568900 RepID=A0A9N8ELT4_9STRA|nr:expressed unknown protein [Seminavis robusta]|eukprot:Sro1500_g277850.1 n/a (645) ;mRNA; f:23680-25713
MTEQGTSSCYLWDMEAHHLLSWLESIFFPTVLQYQHKNHEGLSRLFRNLLWALEATKAVPAAEVRVEAAPKDNSKHTLALQDPYRIWYEAGSEWEPLSHHLPSCMGEKLVSLSPAGLINGLAGVEGGLVECNLTRRVPFEEAEALAKGAGGVTFMDLQEIASVLHQAIQTQRQIDQLKATPTKIQNMVSPNLEVSQLKNIRARVRNTVVAVGRSNNSNEVVDPNHPVALPKAKNCIPEEERDYKCVVCDNINQSLFVLDRKNGDVICSACGYVVCERIIHLGSAYRNFEGEADRNHHGARYNPLFSGAHNTATSLSRDPAGGLGGGRGCSNLRKTHAYIELNLCHLGEGTRKANTKRHETRVGYKDQQKKRAFTRMQHVGDALDLNLAVLELAKELYSEFRNRRQVLKDPEGVIAACLCEAFDRSSLEGRTRLESELQRLRKIASAQDWAAAANNKAAKRAMRRNMLHTVHFAQSNARSNSKAPIATAAVQGEAATVAALERSKPVASWDINDTRAWLLCAARAIAKHWEEHQPANTESNKSLDEFEAAMVEHTFVICEYLENNSQGASPVVGKKVLLMNAKKLSSIVGDVAAAKALHQKIRGVVNRQAVRKSQAARQKASQLRFQQTKRKNWVGVKKATVPSV